MGHNSVVSGYPKSTGIPQVDGLSTRPPDLGRHTGHMSTSQNRPLLEIQIFVELH